MQSRSKRLIHLYFTPIQEVIPIPDIRERNDRPKDKPPKYQVTSTVQRQMVQKFVKELSDSAKQPDRSDSAEHTATEQVEATAREIVHEAVQLPRSFSRQARYTESTERVQPEQPAQPRQTSAPPRQRTEDVRTRPDTTPRSTPTPAPQEQGRRAYVQQASKATATSPIASPEQPQNYYAAPEVLPQEDLPRQTLQSPRQRTEDLRTRSEVRAPQRTPAPTPQEQGRRAYIQQAAKAAQPTLAPEQLQNYHAVPEVPPQEDLPRQNPQSPRQRTEDLRTRVETRTPQSTPAPTPQEQGRRAYVQQAAKAATAPPSIPEVIQESQVSDVPIPENAPRRTPETPRLRADDIRLRSEPEAPQHMPTPAPQEQGRRAYVQKTAKETTKLPGQKSILERPAVSEEPPTEKAPRVRTEDVRTRPEQQKPQSTAAPTAQEQGRRSYMRQAKKSRAEKVSAWDDFHTEKSEIRIAEDIPEREPPSIREKPTITELRGELLPEPMPENTPNVRHIKQTGTWAPRAAEPSTMRGIELPIRERTVNVPTHDLPSTPQARQAFAKKQAQLSQNPSIESIHPPEPAAPISPQPPVSDVPATTPKRQPVTAGSSKSAPPVQPQAPAHAPPVEQLPAIREKPKPNAAPREKSRRGVSIRTKDTEQISTPKAQSKTSVSKIDTKRARKAATQDAQRKMLKKSNFRAARAAVAAAKKLGEAAAKATKELIDALIALGGGTALFVVFSIVIVAGAFLASPLGILFADEQQADDTVPLATAIAEIQGEYHAELEELQNGDYVSIQIVGQAPDWREVVAVFASKTAGAEDGIDVFTLDEERVELLRQVFWDMCEITTATQTVDVPDSDPDDDVDDSHTETALTITITAKTAEQMRMEYSFSKYQNDALDILLENLGSLNVPMGSLNISQEDAIELLENLPDDLDPERKAVVETAVQLVGRVSYFWGGKSLTLGWDDRWGVPTEVTAAGSGSTGTVRPFGLDCSGFVDWTFYNATNGSYYPGRGGGAATQHSYCTNISWSDAQPGNLVFYPDDSHVGIVGGKDADGNLLIVHCSGGANGVVITGSAGFTTVARPDCFSD